MTKTTKWSELEKQGIRRCCGMFKGGGQCRRRAQDGSSWCNKHGPQMDEAIAQNMAVIDAEKVSR